MVLENATSASLKVLEFHYQNIVGTLLVPSDCVNQSVKGTTANNSYSHRQSHDCDSSLLLQDQWGSVAQPLVMGTAPQKVRVCGSVLKMKSFACNDDDDAISC